VSSKKGSKVKPYRDSKIHKNLSSLISKNSHESPEIKLNSSDIFFSGSENSPEKMEVISTKYSVEINYDMIFNHSFENCRQNLTCAKDLPSETAIINDYTRDIMSTNDMPSEQRNREAENWM
tara:strand:- start:131 stop:496 length:366 start_codon:yes stop_codon:yes gene_type:complete